MAEHADPRDHAVKSLATSIRLFLWARPSSIPSLLANADPEIVAPALSYLDERERDELTDQLAQQPDGGDGILSRLEAVTR